MTRTKTKAIAPEIMMQETLRVWEIPFMAGAFWWNQMMSLCWPHLPHAHHLHAAHHDPHEQLVVPEPIEDNGERNLFA